MEAAAVEAEAERLPLHLCRVLVQHGDWVHIGEVVAAAARAGMKAAMNDGIRQDINTV